VKEPDHNRSPSAYLPPSPYLAELGSSGAQGINDTLFGIFNVDMLPDPEYLPPGFLERFISLAVSSHISLELR
jgi:hypothetical protein